jgi:hypothetical protein
MATPKLTLAEIRATPLGKTPVYDELTSLVDHVTNNQDDISALTGGGDPGYNSAIDTRWLLTEIGGVANTYVAVLPNAGGETIVNGFNYWLIGQLANTGPSTLNVGTLEGAIPIKVRSAKSLVDLIAWDIPVYGAYLFYSAQEAAWILQNPGTIGVRHWSGEVAPENSFGEDGDVYYVLPVGGAGDFGNPCDIFPC